MAKYRIIGNSFGFYPQVKKFLAWKRIGVHPDGFGLYDKDDYDYPKTVPECEKIISDYKEWVSKSREITFVKNI